MENQSSDQNTQNSQEASPSNTGRLSFEFLLMCLMVAIAAIAIGFWNYERNLRCKYEDKIAADRKKNSSIIEMIAMQNALPTPSKKNIIAGEKSIKFESGMRTVKTVPASLVENLGLKKGDLVLITKDREKSISAEPTKPGKSASSSEKQLENNSISKPVSNPQAPKNN